MSALLAGVVLFSTGTHAAVGPDARNYRYEVSVGIHSWPDVEDLQPLVSGKLYTERFQIACALHWLVNQRTGEDLLIGFDAGLFPIKSELFAGGGYLLPSFKWRPSGKRTLSVDAGFGFYKVDFAEIANGARLLGGTDVWKKNGFGGFFGGTWNIMSAQRSGLMISFKVHFVYLGSVNGLDLQPPLTLGFDAEMLNRGFYQLQIVYFRE